MNYIDLYQRVIERHSKKPAIVDQNGQRGISYDALDTVANLVAGKLQALGVEKGDFVVINLDRSFYYPAAYLGVLKCGAVVVPVYSAYPRERIEFIKNDCNAKLEVTSDFFEDILTFAPIKGYVTGAENSLLIYTSGSTGRPKGILYSADALAKLVIRSTLMFRGMKNLRLAACAPLSFIVHTLEYLSPFLIGGTIHMMDEETRKSPDLLYKYFEKYKISSAFISPQLLKNFKGFPKSFKRVITGSERVSNIYFDDIEMYNVYGLSELGLCCTFKIDKPYENTPLGKPTPPLKFMILDEDGNQLPQGSEGEICIITNFDVSYYNIPSTLIVKLPEGGVLIHTCDVGYFNNHGDLVYLNRADWMVKINGQRVDTLGVETKVMSLDGVRNAAVKAFEDETTYLVCYYEGDLEDSEVIRDYLKKSLADYMVPQYFIKMDHLPKNINGKLDRTALLPPERASFKKEYVAPANQLEADICQAFENALDCGRVGADDDFISIGGDSIKAAKVLSSLDRPEVTVDMIMEGRTPAAIVKLSQEKYQGGASHLEEIPQVSPLSQSQLGVYMECVDNPDSIKYNIPFAAELPEGIEKDRLIAAVKEVASKNPVFAIHFGLADGVPAMINQPKEFEVAELEYESLEDAKESFVKPFDLENGPLCRFAYVRTPEKNYLLCDIHHLIFDGSSFRPFFRALDKAYAGEEYLAERLNLFDVAAYEQEPKSEKLKKEFLDFFDQKFDGIDPDSKPLPDQNESQTGIGYFAEDFSIPEIKEFAKAKGVDTGAVFLGAFGYALAKFNGTNQSFFTTCHTGRRDGRLYDSIGMFVKTIPMVCKFTEDMETGQLVKTFYDDYHMASKNDCVPFAKLAAEYGLGMGVSFIYQSSLIGTVAMGGKEAPVIALDESISVSDLECMLLETEEGYRLTVHYTKSLYTEALMKSFVSMYIEILRSISEAEKLGDIRFCSNETIRLLADFNKTEKPYDYLETVVELFKKQSSQTPDAECVVYEDKRYTYAQIDEITDRLAGHLKKKGVGQGKVVGVLIPRSEYMVICALGVLKAGGAYLPLDGSYPPERLNLMVEDAGAMMLLTTPELSPIIGQGFDGERMMISDIPSLPALDEELPLPGINDLFVLLYTSGSTGTPKGVMFCHSNTMVTAAWERDFYELGPGSNVTAYASYGFDANVFDTYATITSGATLHIISDEVRYDLIALTEYYNKNKITHTTMTTQVGRQFALMGGSQYLKYLSVAGEKLTPLEPPKGFKLYNLYGPTEGSVLASGFLVDKYYKDIPIGKPTDNTKLYVVDEKDRLLPPGAAGELWIAGQHVTKGYINRPDKTAESYIMNPFTVDLGYERVYKTGDVVRLLPDGNYQFVGRADGQVKVRGFRVELTEVEEVIRRFPGIKDATIAAFDDPAGGKFIAAYVVSDEVVDVTKLNQFIKDEKPPYMVPAVTMQIDQIPLNRNQKVDKKALPKPERKVADLVKPEGEMQNHIFEIVKSVIGHDQLGVNTDLFEAGLTSIATLKLNVVLGKEFDTPVKLDDIKENSTIEKLEVFLQNAKKTKKFALLDDYPITETQKGIFIEWSMDKEALTYNMPVLLKLDDSIDDNQLIQAIKKAVNAHPYLKATLFADENGDIRAKRNDDAEVSVPFVITKELPPMLSPFNLLENKLYRISVIRTHTGKYLFMDTHHIISDGTSQAIILEDINRAYAGETLARENYTGFEAALDEEAQRASDQYPKAKAYFDSIFAGCETDCLPPKAPESEEPGAASLVVKSQLNLSKAGEFMAKHGFTENAFFNGAFGYTLSRFQSKEDPVYTTVYNGRNSSLLANSVSMLVKTLPVMAKAEKDMPVAGFIKNTQDQLMETMSHDIYSFAEISNAYGIHSDILFIYQGDDFAFDQVCGKKAEMVDIGFEVAKSPIAIQVMKTGAGYEYHCDYRCDMYSAQLIGQLLEALDMAAMEFIRKENLRDVSLLSENGKARLDEINDTKYEYPISTAHAMFEKEAMAHPDKVAVISGGNSLTCEKLNRFANRIAHSLIAKGVMKDTPIAFMVDRTIEIPMIELGIMKSGGAFLGVLPTYPDDRVDYILRDANSPIIITTESIKRTRPALFADNKPYQTLTVEDLVQTDREENPNVDVSPNDLVYCIYTSGSTGNPKGVMIEHRNLVCCAMPGSGDYKWFFEKEGGQVCLGLASISFDMSIMDDLLFLIRGKTVCIATDTQIHNPAQLCKLMLENHVDTMLGTPSFLTSCMTEAEFAPVIKNLRCIVSGAEAFPKVLYDTVKGINPGVHILNGYGPTECTITCCAKDLQSAEAITIGSPSANTSFYVIDGFGNILPPYALGELIICGDLVGRGYINLLEKTKACFFTLNGMPAYHTGDVVRFNDQGEVEFFGRKDNQVKLRGFRVELDEIEKCICTYPGVKISKVIVRNNGSEDYLAAFFTADKQIELGNLTKLLKSKLAHYMVPDVMMQLENMPLTPNGKIDKKQLPDVKKESKKSGRKAPKQSLEEQLCQIFKSVLNLDECFVDDNFFENGGTSLSASKVVMQLMSKGVDIEYQYIFDYPTPEELAEYIESLSRKNSADSKDLAAEKDDYIIELLASNTLQQAHYVTRHPLGHVLLTGASGFLGIHVLRELIDRDEGKITCLVRKGDAPSSEDRLKELLRYYFNRDFAELIGQRIHVIDADITDSGLQELLANTQFDTLINCAACVKHYAADDILERINVHGVENLIACARNAGARMIQISTTSIPGVHTEESLERNVQMHENQLFVIDDMDNKYVISKYHAELKMLEAMDGGMTGKIIRVGNLMGRYSDGEFQINYDTNAFLHALRGFATIGKCPVSHATDPMSFSPIDLTAKVIVLLAGTDDRFTAFHADNRFSFDEWQLIEACNGCDIPITPVPDEEYYSDYFRMLGDETVNSKLSGLVTNDRPDLRAVDTNNDFTANVLYRLGFSWPFVDIAYLQRAINSLKEKDYFK